MLIAIMGNTFAERSAVQHQIKIRDHLKFVISNWYLSDLAFKNKDQLKYIVTAFAVNETNDDDVDLQTAFQEGMSGLLNAVHDTGINHIEKYNEVQSQVQNLSHNFNKRFDVLSHNFNQTFDVLMTEIASLKKEGNKNKE